MRSSLVARIPGAQGFAEAEDGDEGADGSPKNVCTDGGGGKRAVSGGDGDDEGDKMEAAKRGGGEADDDEEDFHCSPFDRARSYDAAAKDFNSESLLDHPF